MSPPDPGRADESVRVRPAAGLRPFVAHYSGYRQAGAAPARHRGLPSPYLTLIFTLNDPLVLESHPDPRQPPGSYLALIGGLHTSPAVVSHQGRQSGIQVGLRPPGARCLLGVPAGELAGLDLDAADLLGPVEREIRERMRAASHWPERFGVLDQVLTGRLAAADGYAGVSAEVGSPGAGCWKPGAARSSPSWPRRPAGVTGTCAQPSGRRSG
ncbi:MAG: DUF6597 domain-containing transcriptional factor [Streptosporangiaceae bacterium]|jgi:hypothetical protein